MPGRRRKDMDKAGQQDNRAAKAPGKEGKDARQLREKWIVLTP